MKQQILEALTARFEGVDEKILSRIAEKLSKTVTAQDDVATAVAGVTFQQVLEAYGDSRATEAAKTSVSNYEKKYGLRNGEKIEKEPSSPSKEEVGEGGQSVSTRTSNSSATDLDKLISKALDAAIRPLSEKIQALEADKININRQHLLFTETFPNLAPVFGGTKQTPEIVL